MEVLVSGWDDEKTHASSTGRGSHRTVTEVPCMGRVKCLRKYRSKQGDNKSTFVHLIMCSACGKIWRGTGLRRLMGHFERVNRGKGSLRAGVQEGGKLFRIERSRPNGSDRAVYWFHHRHQGATDGHPASAA
jgi:hypothetical protein